MSVNIANSAGYEGTVDEPEWADLLSMAGGRQYGVAGPGDWKVTVGSGDRQVRIAAGKGFGYGVRDVSTGQATLTLPAPGSGSVWHLIAVHRDWSANQSSFDSIPGSATKAIPARAVTPGTVDDQPLALARVQAGQAQVVEIIDLRVWGGDGGAAAADALALQFLDRLGTRVLINDIEWARRLDSLGNPQWVIVGRVSTSAAIALQSQPGLVYIARAGSLAPRATLEGGRVFLDGGIDVDQDTEWGAGASYQAGVVPAGYRPSTAVSGIVRFGSTYALLSISTSGAIVFSLPVAASANRRSLDFALTGISYPAAT